MLFLSCSSQEQLFYTEAIPYSDTIYLTIPHFNLGRYCFPRETHLIVDQDTLYLDVINF